MIRLSRVLIPPDPEVLSRYCKQGFEDALRFLQRRYLISCTRCLAVDSTYQIGLELFSSFSKSLNTRLLQSLMTRLTRGTRPVLKSPAARSTIRTVWSAN